MTGRLTGSLDGLPVEITAAEGQGLTLRLISLRSLASLLRCRRQFAGIARPLAATGLPVTLELAGQIRVPVSPRPPWLVRWLIGG